MPVRKTLIKPGLIAQPQGATLTVPSQKRWSFGRLGGKEIHGPENLFRGQTPSLWQFWQHGVTSSFISVYGDCPEQARLQYVEGWSTRKENDSLAYGTCVHKIFQNAYEQRDQFFKAHPNQADITAWIEEYERDWRESHPAPTQIQTESLEKICGIAEGMLPGYFKRWGGDFTGRYDYGYGQGVHRPHEWVSLEEIFEIPYTYPDGRTVPIRGRMDGVILDETGKLLVFDTKTKSRIDPERIAKALGNDFQAMLYIWACYEKWKRKQLPQRPNGGIINVVKKPGEHQGKKETFKQYVDRLRYIYGEVSKYDETYFRIQVLVSSGEVEAWKETQLDPCMDEIRGWWEGRYPHWPRSHHVEMKYGPVDMFEPITMGNFSNCYKRASVFPELPEVAA
jgi:hypothetical protein